MPTAGGVDAKRQLRVHEERVVVLWKTHTHTHAQGAVSQSRAADWLQDPIKSQRSPGSGRPRRRFLDRTVDLCTKAASTMARP